MNKLLVIGVIVLFLLMNISSSGFNLEKQSTIATLGGNTLYVGGSGAGNYSTIQDAVDNASNGDTVFVYNGTYYENVEIWKSLTLIGENKTKTIILSPPTQSATVRVYGNNITIKNFTIETYELLVSNILIAYGSNNYITENILISGKSKGISLCRTTNNTITNNILISNESTGITIHPEPPGYSKIEYWNTHIISNNLLNGKIIYYYKNNQNGEVVLSETGQVILANCSNFEIKNLNLTKAYYGILLGYSANNTILNNIIESGGLCGIQLTKSSNNTVKNNKISTYFGGISLNVFSNNNTVDSNELNNNTDGIYQATCSNNIISNNILSLSEFAAIYIDSFTQNCIVTDNQIIDNDFGICYGTHCYGNKIYENNISNCSDVAIWIDPKANNDIYLNNFLNNMKNVKSGSGDINNWDNGTYGNYWDDYTGNDTNGDGIGDTPYLIPGGDNEDRYPLMVPWGIENHPPDAPTMSAPIEIKIGVDYEFVFSTVDFEGHDVSYLIDWGDGTGVGWTDYYQSGAEIIFNHTWYEKGSYVIRAKVKDIYRVESNFSEWYFDIIYDTYIITHIHGEVTNLEVNNGFIIRDVVITGDDIRISGWKKPNDLPGFPMRFLEYAEYIHAPNFIGFNFLSSRVFGIAFGDIEWR